MSVNYVKSELGKITSVYTMIEDCIDGEKQVKSKGDLYLPRPNPEDKSSENNARYESYLTRAYFYNFCLNTRVGLSGLIFMRDINLALPSELDYLQSNADASGITLRQQCEMVVDTVLPLGRGGLLADYPVIDGERTEKEKQNGVAAYITFYHPKSIINWKESGGKLTLLVLAETYDTATDEFDEDTEPQYRVYSLDEDGNVIVRIYRDDLEVPFSGPLMITDAQGKPFKEIPFSFVGSTNNEPSVDIPLFEPLASLNIAWFRNSADFEESCFITGQPTVVISGVDEHWWKEVMGGTVALGSRGGIALPKDGAALMLQPDPNTLPQAAMEAKQQIMIALGAKVIDTKEAEQTRKEVELRHTAETSKLAQIAKNVSAAYKKAIYFCGLFETGTDVTEQTTFELNTDYTSTKLNSDETRIILELYVTGLISFSEMRDRLLQSGIASEIDNKKVKAQIEEDQSFLSDLQPEPEPVKTGPPDAV